MGTLDDVVVTKDELVGGGKIIRPQPSDGP
jgi:hypothetical protein